MVSENEAMNTHPIMSSCPGWHLDTLDDAIEAMVAILTP